MPLAHVWARRPMLAPLSWKVDASPVKEIALAWHSSRRLCPGGSDAPGSNPPRSGGPFSLGVVEDDAEAQALAGGHPADAVAHGRAVGAARARHRPVAGWEDDRLAALEDDDLAARLRAWPLLDEEDLAARIVRPPPAEHAGDLERKGERAVEVLVQAVVAAGRVAEEERGGPRLPVGRAAREVGAELGRK